MGNLIQHLTRFQTITDEEIHQIANGNVEEELTLLMERDFVQTFNKCVVDSLMEMVEKDRNVGKPAKILKRHTI